MYLIKVGKINDFIIFLSDMRNEFDLDCHWEIPVSIEKPPNGNTISQRNSKSWLRFNWDHNILKPRNTTPKRDFKFIFLEEFQLVKSYLMKYFLYNRQSATLSTSHSTVLQWSQCPTKSSHFTINSQLTCYVFAAEANARYYNSYEGVECPAQHRKHSSPGPTPLPCSLESSDRHNTRADTCSHV